MDISGPSLDDIVASNVLAFLSSSTVKSTTELSSSDHTSARIPAQESGILNHINISSRSSSVSMESFKSSAKGGIFSCAGDESSDLDDDGLQGNRMKPLSSLQNNCAKAARLAIAPFCKRRSPNSQPNRTPSKVLAAARVGYRARRKAMYYCDNKENKEVYAVNHMREMKQTYLKNKGVKRKSPEVEGSARLLLLKQRRSTLSSWQTMTTSSKHGPSVVTMIATSSISNCEDMEVFNEKTNLVTQKEPHTFSEVLDDTEHIQANNAVVQGSVISKKTDPVAIVPSTSVAYQGSSLPALCSKDHSSYSSCTNHINREMQSSSSSLKGENLMGLPPTKPPTYPKTKQNMPAVPNGRCSSHPVVNTSHGKALDAMESIDQGNMNNDQASFSFLLEGQNDQATIAEDSVCFMEKEGIPYKDSGADEGLASCKNSHNAESSATCHGLVLQMDSKTSSKTTAIACHNDKVLTLTKPQCLMKAQAIYDSKNVIRLNEIKQEYIVQNSVETGHKFSSFDCGESLSRKPSISDKEDIKDLTGQNLFQNVSSQNVNYMSRSHPVAPRVGTLYQQNHHNSVCLPRVRRGRPPKKSNLCPCPETKENTNKFSRICGPSGILGKLNPGIISRLRDRKQVHAVLEAVIKGAFMTGMKENLTVKKAEGLDAVSNNIVSLARWREGTKEREAVNNISNQGSVLKQELVDQNAYSSVALRDDKERQRHTINRAGVDLESGHRAALEPCKVQKQEQCSSLEPREQMDCPPPAAKQFSRELIKECLEACEAEQNKQCSVETADDQKTFESNISIATGNVASCWLELLRLDIKGRLSALKRSKRRVRGVLVSGQLDDKMSTQADEMDKWRAFFLQMEHILHMEGTRLESWLNQITQMQLSYCHHKGGRQSSMPPVCGFVTQSVDKDTG